MELSDLALLLVLSGHQGHASCQAFSKRQHYILIFKFIQALAILGHCNYNTDRANHTDNCQGNVSGSERTFQHQRFHEEEDTLCEGELLSEATVHTTNIG